MIASAGCDGTLRRLSITRDIREGDDLDVDVLAEKRPSRRADTIRRRWAAP